MRLEYFQMIDRIVDARRRRAHGRDRSAPCRKQSTVFEGHFPGYPLMPGVLLIECMAQTTGWLVSALNGFTAMPFLVGVKEAKFRSRRVSRRRARIRRQGACTRAPATPSANAKGRAQGQGRLRRADHLSHHALSRARNSARRCVEWAERIDIPVKEFAK